MEKKENALGLRIQELRKEKELSQADLAKKAKIARTLITMIESGQRYPSEDALDKIIEALDVSKEDVFTEEVKKQYREKLDTYLENANAETIIKAYRKISQDDK
ncbi:MAG TPA: helix-turn-helix transcriptional regulator [Candidatus Gastranaerophilales bacterium]|nr:helix-turn-helix transcriptional regulator [Candidatus Gastranaerophilales bacterium]